ncbi:MAG: hypothetical protein M1831_004206 [Alyxoria varia]|nr:MAG: hypothetical protein M1831_004206 [Alyxoria varia]
MAGEPLLGVLSAIIIPVSTIVIVLRFWSRFVLPFSKFGADDWIALASYPTVIAYCANNLWWANSITNPQSPSDASLKALFIKSVVFNVAITIVRTSALLFYRRIITLHKRTFEWLFWFGIFFNTAWFLTLELMRIFACIPLRVQWTPPLPDGSDNGGTCMSELGQQLLSAVGSLVIDLYVLILPLPMLRNLQLRMAKKIFVFLVFICSYFVPLTSLARTIIVIKQRHNTTRSPKWGNSTTTLWCLGELAIAFIGISMPAIFYLVRRWYHHGTSSLFSDRDYAAHEKPQLQTPESGESEDNRGAKLKNLGFSGSSRERLFRGKSMGGG